MFSKKISVELMFTLHVREEKKVAEETGFDMYYLNYRPQGGLSVKYKIGKQNKN